MDEQARWDELGAAAQQILDQLDPLRRWTVLGAGPEDDLVQVEVRGRDGQGDRWEPFTVCVLPDEPWPETVELLASRLQDYVVESTLNWGAAVPECPGHRHPADAATVDGAAVWSCPATGAVLRPILA